MSGPLYVPVPHKKATCVTTPYTRTRHQTVTTAVSHAIALLTTPGWWVAFQPTPYSVKVTQQSPAAHHKTPRLYACLITHPVIKPWLKCTLHSCRTGLSPHTLSHGDSTLQYCAAAKVSDSDTLGPITGSIVQCSTGLITSQQAKGSMRVWHSCVA